MARAPRLAQARAAASTPEGSGKLVEAVKATPGAIGYVSSDHLLREGLSAVSLRNQLGDRAVAGTGFAPLPAPTQARIVAPLTDLRTPEGQRVPVPGRAQAPRWA